MVGAAGFELATYWSQTSCATRLRYVCEQHIQQCVGISKLLMLPASQAADVAS